jgi:hypothetical protein
MQVMIIARQFSFLARCLIKSNDHACGMPQAAPPPGGNAVP